MSIKAQGSDSLTRIELIPSAMEAQNSNHWTARESLGHHFDFQPSTTISDINNCKKKNSVCVKTTGSEGRKNRISMTL